MKHLIIAASVTALASCQTVRVNGVEITPGEQAKWGLVAAALAGAIYYLEHKQAEDEAPQKCAQFVSVPTGKGGFICAEDM